MASLPSMRETDIAHDTGIAKGITGQLRSDISGHWKALMTVPTILLASSFAYTLLPVHHRSVAVVGWTMALAAGSYAHHWTEIKKMKSRSDSIRAIQLGISEQRTEGDSDAYMQLHHELLST